MTAADTLKNELKQTIVEIAALDVDWQSLPDDAPLTGDQIGLDSIDILELVVHLEKTYGIKIRNTPEGRATLANISAISAAIGSAKISAEANTGAAEASS